MALDQEYPDAAAPTVWDSAMTYAHVPVEHIQDPSLKRVVTQASALLADTYSMLGVRPPAGFYGGQCNFAIGLVLACIVDGLATEVWPVEPVDDRLKRMTILLEKHMRWGQRSDGWINRTEAAQVLYFEIRNPLVHNLGADTRWRGRRRGFADTAFILETRNKRRPSPDELEQRATWPSKSPVIWTREKSATNPARFVVSASALYWHVKKLTSDLAADPTLLIQSVKRRIRRRVM